MHFFTQNATKLKGTPGEEYIRSKALIYGRNPSKKLTKYQEHVNRAAIELALNDPNVLASRQSLLRLAQDKVRDDGYIW